MRLWTRVAWSSARSELLAIPRGHLAAVARSSSRAPGSGRAMRGTASMSWPVVHRGVVAAASGSAQGAQRVPDAGASVNRCQAAALDSASAAGQADHLSRHIDRDA